MFDFYHYFMMWKHWMFHHWRAQSIIFGYQAINSNGLEQTATREHQSGVRKYTFAILLRELWKNDSAHG